MKLSKRANTIILWILAVALLVGMIVTFTPTLGNFGGAATTETVALRVNGQPITALEVARAQQNQLYNRVSEGEVGDDLELLLLNELVRQELLRQAAAQTNVSGGEVRTAVNEWRASQGVAGRNNDSAYLSVINRLGFTDETFRDYWREQLRQEKYLESLTESVSVTDAEVQNLLRRRRPAPAEELRRQP
ncbi:MAG: SurA N-terminal domain-containing protein [Trueperaceae bacterium]|nr:SurA N-terminal domain-containing protein [Trueperaceae bacterium]